MNLLKIEFRKNTFVSPDKENDSKANPKIHLIENCPTGMIAYKIRRELKEITINQKVKDVLIIGEGKSCKTILKNIANQLSNYGFKNIDYNKEDSVFGIKQEIVDAYRFIEKDQLSLLGWRILGNPTDEEIKDKHIKNSKTLNNIITGTPSKIKIIKDIDIDILENDIEECPVCDKEIRKYLLFQEIKNKNNNLSRPLGNLNLTVCNILKSKGLGADVVFVVGFDQGKFPAKTIPEESEIYQMLVALTRAKKRIYFINTTGVKVSSFIDCLDKKDLESEKIS